MRVLVRWIIDLFADALRRNGNVRPRLMVRLSSFTTSGNVAARNCVNKKKVKKSLVRSCEHDQQASSEKETPLPLGTMANDFIFIGFNRSFCIFHMSDRSTSE